MLCKPANRPVVHRPRASLLFWAGWPGPTFPGDSGDVCDLMRRTPAGTRSGCVWSAGELGSCLSFGGGTIPVSFPSAAGSLLDLNRNFTIAVWFTPSFLSGDRGLVSHGDSSYYLRTSSGKLNFIRSQRNDVLAGATTLAAGNLYHAAVTLGSGSTAPVVLYLNGARDAAGTTALAYAVGVAPLRFGADETTDAFLGTIHDVRIFGSALSDAEVSAEYARPWEALSRHRRAGYSPAAPAATTTSLLLAC